MFSLSLMTEYKYAGLMVVVPLIMYVPVVIFTDLVAIADRVP